MFLNPADRIWDSLLYKAVKTRQTRKFKGNTKTDTERNWQRCLLYLP